MSTTLPPGSCVVLDSGYTPALNGIRTFVVRVTPDGWHELGPEVRGHRARSWQLALARSARGRRAIIERLRLAIEERQRPVTRATMEG